MDRMTDRETSLARIVGRGRSARLLAGLKAARTTKACFTVAEAWMVEGLKGEDRDDLSQRAVKTILKARGQIRIADVAERCGATARQLERAFAGDLGIRPKLFARVVRLNAFLERLGETQRERMVDLALDAGYFDQAHLLLDFRALTGRTPARAKEAAGDLARHFTLPPRLRALFAFE
jgi:methylphosphotriester-DNA--protein-cysteine methyltransferase